MGAYEKFAQVYDLFMDNIDYEEWADYITDHLKKYGIEDGLVLELGCGTGTMTGLLADRGYDMIGVDNSGEMLAEAMEKRMESGQDILYLQQDMQEFELYGTVRAIVSVCDSLNYITEREELLQVFRLVNNYLDPEGLFLFDMNTIHKYRDILGDTTIAENRDEGSFIWDNSYDPENGLNIYELAVFLPREDGLYEKAEEVHCQKAYSQEEIEELIREAGIRMPGALSGTIGIVGGLIIGDAAVSANLVSPMAVVIVALSALSSFAIPNEECTSAFRLIKYGFILLGGLLGMYGIVLGLYLLLGHLARLTSFKIPYLMPFIGKDIAGYQDERDLLVRAPMRKMRYRPIYTRRFQRVRLREK